MPTCWECGGETPTTVTATLRLTSGAPRQFQLCPPCYEAHYLPLLAEDAGADTAQSAPEAEVTQPPRPRSRRRSGRTDRP